MKLSDLESDSNWNMLCSQYGQHIPSDNTMSNAFDGEYNSYDSLFKSLDWSEVIQHNSATVVENEYKGKVYHSDDIAYYAVTSTNVCNPLAAYIFNMIKPGQNSYGVTAGSNYTDIQFAWWTNLGQYYAGGLYDDASLYQSFVKKIAKNKSDVDNVNTYKTISHTFDDGQTMSIDFPEIDTEKMNITFNEVESNTNEVIDAQNSWATNAKVTFDAERQKYIVGPFSINYIEARSNGAGVDFGVISGFDIYTDADYKNPLSKEQWRFVWTENSRKDDNYQYPHAKEVFYIELDNIENATKIIGMDIDYKYLIAGAQYQTLDGTYDQYLWKVKRDLIEKIKDSDGNITGRKYKYYLSAKGQNLAQESQKLALVNKAARWYETQKISVKQKEAEIKIVKKVIDEKGKELSLEDIQSEFGENQYFDFRITVKHEDGEVERNDVTVRAGDVGELSTFSFKENEKELQFTVDEVPPSNGIWELESITPSSGILKDGDTIVVTAVNKITKSNENNIKINKSLSNPAKTDETFKFDVTVTMPDGSKENEIATIVVPAGARTGNEWTSKTYKWYGEAKPHYEIKEIETEDSKKYTPSITPSSGDLDGSGASVQVNALNTDKVSYLTVEKAVLDGQVTEDTFDYRITVNGVKNTTNGTYSFEVKGVKAGQKVGPYGFEWEDLNKAPTFTVEEININSKEAKVNKITAETEDGKSVGKQDGNKITGNLVNDATTSVVNAKFTNDMTQHKGGIKVEKDIYTTEKISKDYVEKEKIKFEVEVVISGTFVHNGKTYQNSTEVITKSLPDNGNWSFSVDDVDWYGSKAPTYTVREKNLPKGWRCKTITYSDLENSSTSSEGHNLVDGKTVEVKIINELPTTTIIDLTFSMAGIVWVDSTLDEKNGADNGYYSAPNGVYDKGETLKENAEVTVYRVVYNGSNEVKRTIAKEVYKDMNNNEVTFPIVTKSDGKWDVPRIKVPTLTEEEKNKNYTVSYDVEFVYDGQTYEPTEFLSYQVKGDTRTKNSGSNAEKATNYRNAKSSVKDKYANDSMALAVNTGNEKVIANVSGKTEINANGDTTGIATFTDGTQAEISYSSDNAGTGYPTISKLNTTDKNGKVLDIFKGTARTSAGNLTFPFDVDGYDGSALTNVNTIITDSGIQRTYKFTAVYNYCLNINLGLKERATADVALTKKLDNAKVVVKEKMYQYNYSGHYDLTEQKVNSLEKDVQVGNAENVEFKLGLYRSDYYYRAEMYNNNKDMYDALTSFYSTLNKNIEDTEMDIYLKYKIQLMNGSSKYDVKVNSIDDYYASNLTLVKTEETKYLKTQTIAGKEEDVNALVKVADASDFSDKWVDVKTGILGSDKDGDGNNIAYNKMTASDLGIVLAPGETKEITMTFKINKGKDNSFGIDKSIILGQKCNVAEIANYSTFNTGTTNYAGKIDRDSAPSNLNLSAYNKKSWYEDDTFAAPILKVNLVESNQERTINGIVWEDNSKDKNTENPGYNQQVGNGMLDSGEKEVKGLTTELVEKVTVPNNNKYTDYDYIWPTDQKLDCLNGKTIEEVSGLDSIIKTSDKGEYTFTNAPAGDYVVRFVYGDDKIESADYSNSKYYNGQDYKSAKFTSNLKDGNEIKADSYLNIDNLVEKTNTAVDNEVQRLKVVSNSREITYDNGVVMYEYQDKLFSDYTMFADTPKIDMNIERTTYGDNNYQYNVNNINFALEERPMTEISLDKQIEEITLTTSDGNKIMDAKYNINYEIADDGSIKAKVELDTRNSYGTDNLQALNRDEANNQGFRYINVDNDILEGTTITVKYKFTVLNTGEVDRTGKLADMNYAEDENAFKQARDELSTKLATYSKVGNSLKNDTKLGEYVGSIYYYGVNGDQSDKVVTSTVRQLVDYIDNDMTFDGTLNATANTSWSNITTAELKSLIKDEIITNIDGKDVILDSDGIQYETENRNNLAVNVDSIDTTSSINNSGFIVELVPYQAKQGDKAVTDKDCQSSMYLTTTKYVGADSDDLQIDNIAEIIKYNNKVGRRDEITVPGNQEPMKALETKTGAELLTSNGTLSDTLKYERDTSATEMITLSPPTGIGLMKWKIQVLGVTLAGLTVVAGGIILIKKKILK